MQIRVASQQEKELLVDVWRLAGSPNFNAWALPILRREAEAVLKDKAPDKVAAFIASRMLGRDPGGHS